MKKINLRDVIIFALSLILCVGAMTIFKVCGPKEDGSFMMCHWAGEVVIYLGGVMAVIALAKFFVNAEVKKGLDLALIPIAAFAAYLPNNVITLCKMETMRCHAIFKPSVILISVLIIAAVAANIFFSRRSAR